MANNRIYGNRRGSRSGVRPEPSPSSPSRALEATDVAEEQGGTPDDVLKSNELAVRGLVRKLAECLHAASSVTLDALGEDGTEFYGALRGAADTLFGILRR